MQYYSVSFLQVKSQGSLICQGWYTLHKQQHEGSLNTSVLETVRDNKGMGLVKPVIMGLSWGEG